MSKYKILLFIIISCGFNCLAQNAETNGLHLFLEEDSVVVYTNSQKKLFIVADSFPIYKDALIKVIFPKVYSQQILRDGDFLANIRAGYTTVGSVSSDKRASIIDIKQNFQEFSTIPSAKFNYVLQHDVNQTIITIKMIDTLPKGDTLLVNFGANGVPTYTANYAIVHTDSFVALINNNATAYSLVKSTAKLHFINNNRFSVYPVLSANTKKGNPTILKLIVRDNANNPAKNFIGKIGISCTDNTAIFQSTIDFTIDDKGVKDIPITFNKDGIFTVTCNPILSNFPITGTFISNPTNCSNDSLQIYFGDFHTHTGFSRDGQGASGYQYARYGNGLDFYCGTDHSDISQIDTFGISANEWKELKRQASATNVNGRFVSFLGYENSLDYPSGHYNFYYDYPDSLIDLVPMLSKHFNFNIQNLWLKLNTMSSQVRVLTIPHTTGLLAAGSPDAMCSQFGGTFANNTYKRLIEIYSSHGLCESYETTNNLSYSKVGSKSTTFPCYAQDGWAKREKLGVIASTDTHDGKSAKGNAGIVAIISDTLTRKNLFDNLYNRHTYATTGSRMILKFYANNYIMGDEFTLTCDSFPRLAFEVNGTADLDYIEILKWDFVNGTYTPNPAHPKFEIIKRISFPSSNMNYKYTFLDFNFKDTSMYYLRVKQKDIINNREVWAWSSPIWVNRGNCTYGNNLKTDSIFNFNANFAQRKVNIKWNIYKEFKTDYYDVERSVDSINFSAIERVYSYRIPLLDTNYVRKDSLLFAPKYYYRIKQVSYKDSIKYTPIISVLIPIVNDSILQFDASIAANGIENNWNTTEFYAQQYNLNRSANNNNFQSIYQVNAIGNPSNNYQFLDTNPLEDSSFYKVIMQLPNRTFKISKTDTIYFPVNIITNFTAQKQQDSALVCFNVKREKNVLEYDVLRSNDSINYTVIKIISPTGNLFDSVQYCLYDYQPFPGKNYYKIIAKYTNGNTKQTVINLIDFITKLSNNKTSAIQFSVLDNLIAEGKNDILIKANSDKIYSGNIGIYDISGRQHYQSKQELQKGESYFTLPITYLDAGNYFVIFYNDEFIIKNSFTIIHNH